jgi:cytochrome oxidase Cu insertion factor (SCO1/SenC/PrrC family)
MRSILVIFLSFPATMSWKVFPTPNFAALAKKVAVISAAVAVQVNCGQSISPALADAIPVVGAPAPSFTLPSNTGKSIGLPDLLGKRTVLYFYPV